MVLSNAAKMFLAAVCILPGIQGCGWWQGGSTARPVVAEPKSEMPFSTKEPDVFQAEFVRSDGITEDKSFYARKGEKLRYDSSSGRSMILNDKMYSVRHDLKIYAEFPSLSNAAGIASDLTNSLLSKRDYTKFAEIGRGGNITQYKAMIENFGESEVMIDFDNSIGMVVREKFVSQKNNSSTNFVFEMRNFGTEVDDNLFAIPKGYRKVSFDEINRTSNHRK